jgi:hypothetical protein
MGNLETVLPLLLRAKKSNFSSFWSLDLTHYLQTQVEVRLNSRTQELEKFDTFLLSKVAKLSLNFPF